MSADITDGEVSLLVLFRYVMKIALLVIPPRGNKGRLLEIVTRMTEGYRKEYKTGSGQTRATARRVLIYQQEGCISPRPKLRKKISGETASSQSIDSLDRQQQQCISHSSSNQEHFITNSYDADFSENAFIPAITTATATCFQPKQVVKKASATGMFHVGLIPRLNMSAFNQQQQAMNKSVATARSDTQRSAMTAPMLTPTGDRSLLASKESFSFRSTGHDTSSDSNSQQQFSTANYSPSPYLFSPQGRNLRSTRESNYTIETQRSVCSADMYPTQETTSVTAFGGNNLRSTRSSNYSQDTQRSIGMSQLAISKLAQNTSVSDHMHSIMNGHTEETAAVDSNQEDFYEGYVEFSKSADVATPSHTAEQRASFMYCSDKSLQSEHSTGLFSTISQTGLFLSIFESPLEETAADGIMDPLGLTMTSKHDSSLFMDLEEADNEDDNDDKDDENTEELLDKFCTDKIQLDRAISNTSIVSTLSNPAMLPSSKGFGSPRSTIISLSHGSTAHRRESYDDHTNAMSEKFESLSIHLATLETSRISCSSSAGGMLRSNKSIDYGSSNSNRNSHAGYVLTTPSIKSQQTQSMSSKLLSNVNAFINRLIPSTKSTKSPASPRVKDEYEHHDDGDNDINLVRRRSSSFSINSHFACYGPQNESAVSTPMPATAATASGQQHERHSMHSTSSGSKIYPSTKRLRRMAEKIKTTFGMDTSPPPAATASLSVNHEQHEHPHQSQSAGMGLNSMRSVHFVSSSPSLVVPGGQSLVAGSILTRNSRSRFDSRDSKESYSSIGI